MPRSTEPAHRDSAAAAYRERLAATIAAELQGHPRVRAIGEGGAAARGRADQFSDLDLVIVALLEDADELFSQIESTIRTVAPITHVWRVDPPGFPEMAQRFYFVEGAPRYFAIDCSIVSKAGLAPFLERERHGTFVAWSDPEHLLAPRRADRAALAKRREQRLQQLRGAIPVYSMLVEKELARGHSLEALGFYQAMLRIPDRTAGNPASTRALRLRLALCRPRTSGSCARADRATQLCQRRREATTSRYLAGL